MSERVNALEAPRIAKSATPLPGFVHEILIAVSLSVLCVLRRIATLDPVNIGGDATTKWQFVREWFYGVDFAHLEWNHHLTRFGVLVPAYFSQALLGHGLRAYYAVPIAASVIQVLAVYGCGKRLSGRFAGVVAALLLIYTGVMESAGSQLLPDLFTGMYAICTTYAYLRFADETGRKRTAWLVAGALFAFIGYLAKETMVFFYPGMALAVLLAARKPKELAIFCGVLLLGLALETLAYRAFTPFSSRFAVVLSSHIGDADTGRADTTFWGLFERYRHIDKPWVSAFNIFLPCWLGVLAFMRNYRARGMLMIVASFFFFLTFLVRGFHPLLLWQRFQSRYLDPGAPFVALVIGLFLTLVAIQLWEERSARPFWQRVWQRAARSKDFAGPIVLVLCIALGISNEAEAHAAPSPFSQGRALGLVADDTYLRGLPLIVRKRPGARANYARALETLYSVYMAAEPLKRDGKLPDFAHVSQTTRNFAYLIKDPSARPPERVSRLVDAGCALEVREYGVFLSSSIDTVLPASCDALAAN